MINVYAMGTLKEGKTVADIAPQRAAFDSGLVASTQPATTQPAGAIIAAAPSSQPSGTFATRP